MIEIVVALLLAFLSIDGIRRVIFGLKNKRVEIIASEWEVDFKEKPFSFIFFILLYLFAFLFRRGRESLLLRES